MIRLNNIKAPLDFDDAWMIRSAARILGVKPNRINKCTLAHQSVDARKKDDVCFVLHLDVALDKSEETLVSRLLPSQGGLHTLYKPPDIPQIPVLPDKRPVVIGFGPAGMFASLLLSEAGLSPLVLERGKDADTRLADVEAYWSNGSISFSPESNVQFGEGGAGTFSDGKLNTGIKDPWSEFVLRSFVRFGAPQEILTDAKPHIGTDRLTGVVKNLRQYISSLGADVLFGAKVTRIVRSDSRVRSLMYEKDGHNQEILCDNVVLAIGHSSRDTFAQLHSDQYTLIPKPFSIGARIEHPQHLIDTAQYGSFAGHPRLTPADYKLSCHLPSGRSVYTFCMCPGGQVVAAASEPESVVTNGMSRYARDAANANSALLVGISPEDFGSDHPLAGMFLQRSIEQRAFVVGGGSGHAPCQSVGSLLHCKVRNEVIPSYRPGVADCPMDRFLPSYVVDSMREALPLFGRRIRGFDSSGAMLTGPETRSSSPVRIPRDSRYVSIDASGLYPCGEGAGYSGGITSAAVDGLRCAHSLICTLAEAAI